VTGPAHNLRALLAFAESHGCDAVVVRGAARELVALLDQPLPDRRRMQSYSRAKDIACLREKGLTRAVICERLGLSRDQYHRALKSGANSATFTG
jgi:hypothetical protein